MLTTTVSLVRLSSNLYAHRPIMIGCGVVDNERRPPNIFGENCFPQVISGQGGAVHYMKFGELILRKIIEIVATRCHI